MPQNDFGAKVGYDGGTVSRVERGDLRMSRGFAESVAKIDPEKRGPAWLLYGIVTVYGDIPPEVPIAGEVSADGAEKPTPLVAAPVQPGEGGQSTPETARPPRPDDRSLYETLRQRTLRQEKEKKGRKKQA